MHEMILTGFNGQWADVRSISRYDSETTVSHSVSMGHIVLFNNHKAIDNAVIR